MIFIIMGLLVGGLSIPLVLGKIPPNQWYGIRLPAAFQSPENWYRINRVGGWALIGWSMAVIAMGIVLMLKPLRMQWPESILILFVPLFLAIILVIIMAIYANKMDK